MTPADAAISRMRSPRDMSIICIDVTNRCDLRCSNCTRLLANQSRHWDMTPDNFRTALRSLNGFGGVIAMIGGNPCVHPEFEALCAIFVEEVPNKRQRGLWSNNVLKHQQMIADTFGFFNLNPHGDERGIASLERLSELIPGVSFYTGHSQHAPLLAAVRDVIPDEVEMWDAISRCDINRNWSASIVQNNGNLRAYFCEVAASFDLARGEDHGRPVYPGWWRGTIADFSDQVKKFCPGCGVPARLVARRDNEETDDYTASNADIVRGRRNVVPLNSAAKSRHAVTDYSEAHRSMRDVTVSVVIPAYNAADTIAETIASVKAQSVEAEIIVVDDCSTDETLDVVHCIPGVELLTMRGNSGPASARNFGLRHATGDYVCFLDADDCYHENFLASAVQVLVAHPELAAVITDVELVGSHREVHPLQLQAIVFSLPSNMLVRRQVADLIGGFPEHAAFRGEGAGEDVAFKQALQAYFRVGYLQQPLLRYAVRRDSHFDRFLDTTVVVDGKLTVIGNRDPDGLMAAAAMSYAAQVARRIDAVERTRKRVEVPAELAA